ncbi:MAG: hypothetical protein QOE10_5 [Gaiellales bacterium]|jgi:hypothetical protein|nr:hypothetical protein [Gaiellales bacterium]
MPSAAHRHRSTWLRRTRAVTAWIAALAATATLLIAAVVGSASTTKKGIAHVQQRPRVRAAQRASTAQVVHRTRTHHHHVTKARVQPSVPAAATTPPAPAPAVAPVVVSGGS